MEIVDVVRKLIGPIEPIGETQTDAQRYDNIRLLTALIDELLTDINDVSGYRKCQEHSRNKAGEYAYGFLKNIGKEYGQ